MGAHGRFLEDARIPLDNNESEAALRRVADEGGKIWVEELNERLEEPAGPIHFGEKNEIQSDEYRRALASA